MIGWLKRLLGQPEPSQWWSGKLPDGRRRPDLTLPATLLVEDMRKVLAWKPKERQK